MGQRAALSACVGALALSIVTASHAFPYVAKRGDTLATISLKFYGRVDRERILVTANGLGEGAALVPGARIDVPATTHHRVTQGETWETIAEQYLGEARRAEALALANESMPWIPVERGREIVIPYVLRYVARPGDSTPSIAYSFLGHRDDAYVVDRFNGLGGRPLQGGDVLLLPVVDLALTDEGANAAKEGFGMSAREGDAGSRDAQLRAEEEVPLLTREIREGRWVPAIARGNQLLGAGPLPDSVAARVHRALLEAYVALDEAEAARAACDDWRRLEPDRPLDPVELSPKIIRACATTAGGVRHGTMGEDVAPPPSATTRPRPPESP